MTTFIGAFLAAVLTPIFIQNTHLDTSLQGIKKVKHYAHVQGKGANEML